MKQYEYHYFYKITNLINGNYYYGIHSTDNLNDNYMGSGKRLLENYKIYGKENFTKEILKFFDKREDASLYEALMVTENIVHDKNCYNVRIGGDYGTTAGTVLVKDKNEKWQRCSLNDERYINGELVVVMTNKVSVFDKTKNKYCVIDKDEYYKNKEKYLTFFSGKVTVKDANGNYLIVDLDDERYLKGELKPMWCGKKHKKETILKQKETFKNNGHQQGEKNSQYGTCWMTKDDKNIKVKLDEVDMFIQDGWKCGRYVGDIRFKRKLTNDMIVKIKTLKESGMSWYKISKELGVNRSTLFHFRKNMESKPNGC